MFAEVTRSYKIYRTFTGFSKSLRIFLLTLQKSSKNSQQVYGITDDKFKRYKVHTRSGKLTYSFSIKCIIWKKKQRKAIWKFTEALKSSHNVRRCHNLREVFRSYKKLYPPSACHDSIRKVPATFPYMFRKLVVRPPKYIIMYWGLFKSTEFAGVITELPETNTNSMKKWLNGKHIDIITQY